MEPEKDDGNIEYKLKLINLNESRVNHLATQMRNRCIEGNGEAFYEIGVEDDGKMTGITDDEYNETIKNINLIASKNNYVVNLLSSTIVDDNKKIYEVLIREKNENKYIDIKVAVAGGIDSGKCLGYNTPVILYNGTIKMVQDIKVGDLLMGDDSIPRKVLEILLGKGTIYEIECNNGDKFKVNKNHILCFKTNYDLSSENHEIIKIFLKNKLKSDNIIEISFEEYIKLPINIQNILKLYKTNIDFPERKLPIESYLYGYLLGIKISTYINTEYNIFKNNIIPDEYKYNSINNRLKLLAGLIDGNNSLYINCLEFSKSIKKEKILDDIFYIIKSLGFSFYENEKNNLYRIYINCQEIYYIPTRVIKSKNHNYKSLENNLMIGIKNIKIIGLNENYYGFELDGNNRFLLGDFTVTHNSSLIGTLISGEKDNGRGLSRSHVFVHSHELKTGRTSTISHQIIGYDHQGKIVNYQGLGKLSWEEIVQKSCKIISIIDLAGHEKYLKTTILGLSSFFPDICMIIVDANNGIKPMTKEHIILCITLKIPFIIVVTKIDICKDRQNVLQETIHSINKILKYPGIKRIQLNIKSKEDILLSIKHIYNQTITPVFYVSNTTGEGIDSLKYFFNILNKKETKNDKNYVEYHIHNIFNVNGFGIVVGGNLISGCINIGDKLLMGPLYNGDYETVTIKSIHCKKIPLQSISSGQYVCLGFKKIDKNIIKRGNVIISNNSEKISVKNFTAKINVLKTHTTTVKIGYEPIFHAYSIRTVVKIIKIKDKKNSRDVILDDDCLRNNDSAIVDFEFKIRPHFLKIGTTFVLVEGKTKVMGEVISLK